MFANKGTKLTYDVCTYVSLYVYRRHADGPEAQFLKHTLGTQAIKASDVAIPPDSHKITLLRAIPTLIWDTEGF